MKNTFVLFLFTTNLLAFKVDQTIKDKDNFSILKTGKEKSERFYELKKEVLFRARIADVLKSILIYDEKCNSEFKDKRILISKDKKCKYHNDNLIETKVHNLMDNKDEKFFVLERRVFNREIFANVDMVTVKKQKDGSILINQRMLSDSEAKRYIKNPIKQNSVFSKVSASYKLVPTKDSTKVVYDYNMVTDHWMLNKSIAVSRVFESMQSGTNLLFKSIEKELGTNQEAVQAAPLTGSI